MKSISLLLLMAFYLQSLATSAAAQSTNDPPTQEGLQTRSLEDFKQLRNEFEQLQKQLEIPCRAFLEIQPVAVLEADDEPLRLKKENFNTAVAELQLVQKIYWNGIPADQLVVEAGKRVMQSGLVALLDPRERIHLLTNYLAFTRMRESLAKLRVAADSGEMLEVLQARYDRLSTEILLLKEKAKLDTESNTLREVEPSVEERNSETQPQNATSPFSRRRYCIPARTRCRLLGRVR